MCHIFKKLIKFVLPSWVKVALCLLDKRCFRSDCQFASEVNSLGHCPLQLQPENKATLHWLAQSFLRSIPFPALLVEFFSYYLCYAVACLVLSHTLSTCCSMVGSTPLRDLQCKGPGFNLNRLTPPGTTFITTLPVD